MNWIHWSHRIHPEVGLLWRDTSHHWIPARGLSEVVHHGRLGLGLLRGHSHPSPLHLIANVVVDLVGEHVDDSTQTLLLSHLQVLMVVPDNNIEQILIVQLHSLALKVVVFEFRLKSDRHAALAGEFKEAPLGLLDWRCLLNWYPLGHALWWRPLVTSWLLLIIIRHFYAKI